MRSVLCASCYHSQVKRGGRRKEKLASSLSLPLVICISRVALDPRTGATNALDPDAAPLGNSALVPEINV